MTRVKVKPGHNISYKTAYAPNEDSLDQSLRCSLEDALDPWPQTLATHRAFCEDWPDCTDAHVDLSLL